MRNIYRNPHAGGALRIIELPHRQRTKKLSSIGMARYVWMCLWYFKIIKMHATPDGGAYTRLIFTHTRRTGICTVGLFALFCAAPSVGERSAATNHHQFRSNYVIESDDGGGGGPQRQRQWRCANALDGSLVFFFVLSVPYS